jgi:hypothetical protein
MSKFESDSTKYQVDNEVPLPVFDGYMNRNRYPFREMKRGQSNRCTELGGEPCSRLFIETEN